MKRYSVCVEQDPKNQRGHYYIYDKQLHAECSLPLSEANLSAVRPLRWTYSGDIHGPDSFMAWDAACRYLSRCIEKWGYAPKVAGPHPQDVNWQKVAKHLQEAARANTYR